MVEYPWGWRTHPFPGGRRGVTQNVQCFTVKWFDCAFEKGAQCSPRWIIKSTPLIYIFLRSAFPYDLTRRRSAGEIWLRDTLWFDYLLRGVWLKSCALFLDADLCVALPAKLNIKPPRWHHDSRLCTFKSIQMQIVIRLPFYTSRRT